MAVNKNITTHNEQLVALKRIAGQVKGVQRMVEEGQYCIDIVIQIHAIANALYSVSEKVLIKHIDGCVVSAFDSGDQAQKRKKLDELMKVIHMLHKLH